MKIHFEGTRKELLRQLSPYYCHPDFVVLEISEIRKQVGLKGVYYFDIAVENRIINKDITDEDETDTREFILDQLYGYNIPLSRREAYEEAYYMLSSYIENEEKISVEDIKNKLEECKEYMANNKEHAEYYETHRLAKLF